MLLVCVVVWGEADASAEGEEEGEAEVRLDRKTVFLAADFA